MKTKKWTYSLRELPDPAYPPYRILAGGDVPRTIQADAEHLPRTLADFPPDSVSVAIRFVFTPLVDGQDPQQRLSVYLIGQAHQEDMAVGLSLLLARSPFRRFYDLRLIKKAAVDWKQFRAACDVVRRQSLLDPTVTPEFNPKVLPVYYVIRSFEPNQDNDHLLLDSVLGRLQEPALIEFCFEPADVNQDLSSHTRYLSLLQQVNRIWDIDDEDLFGGEWGNTSEDWHPASRSGLKPLRNKDPLADEILRQQQRFHETLAEPHLRFHIRVLAQTPAVARLLASVVGESAFEEGSYSLMLTRLWQVMGSLLVTVRQNIIGLPRIGPTDLQSGFVNRCTSRWVRG